MQPSTTFFALLYLAFFVSARNITIFNNSSQLVYSPAPCFIQNVSGCSTDWFLNDSDASEIVTSTHGPNVSNSSDSSLTFIPRVSLIFTGFEITFLPGPESGALASVTVDDLPSVLVDTSLDAFKGTSLGQGNHSIAVTWAGSGSGGLDVLSFTVVTEDATSSLSPPQSTSTSSAVSLFSSPLPSSTTLSPSPLPTESSGPDASLSPASSHTPSTGTIAVIAITATAFVLLAAFTWYLTRQRRRRRRAVRREKAILGEMKMPSEAEGIGATKGKNQDLPHFGGDKAKGKSRQRDSLLPNVHYTPWRGR